MSQSKIKVITLFTGIGAQEAALKRLNIPFEVVGISEIDKYAIQSYEAINGPTFNYGDITKIPMLDYADLWTYSFPCQDLSVAGKQAGISEGTRSGLLLHVERLLETAVLLGNQPKYLLLENVKALVSKKFKPDFDRWLKKLDSLGYNNYWQVLNAKDYGVPQNRERVFVVSIRKDVDILGYNFPEKIPLTRKLKDVLEVEVPERYYLPQEKIKKLIINGSLVVGQSIEDRFNFDYDSLTYDKLLVNMDKEISNTIRCGGGGGSLDGKHTWDIIKEPQVLTPKRNEYGKAVRKEYEAGNFTDSRHNMTDMQPRVDGVSNTLTTVQKDNYLLEPLHIKEATQKGFADAYEGDSISLDQPNSTTRRGRVGNQISNTLTCSCNTGVVQIGNLINTDSFGGNPQAGRVYSTDGVSPTLNTMQGGQREPKILDEQNGYIRKDGCVGTLTTDGSGPKHNNRVIENSYRIRKLTPLECWRLMDFTDEEFYAAQLSGVSNSQLYKCAGNSIVVAVLQAIFKELLA